MLKTSKIARKVYVNQDHSVSAYTDTDKNSPTRVLSAPSQPPEQPLSTTNRAVHVNILNYKHVGQVKVLTTDVIKI